MSTAPTQPAPISHPSIIHVGPDDCHRVDVLRTAGYLVNNCTSFYQLHSALILSPPAEALAISESLEELAQKAVSLARSTTAIPLILFQGIESHFAAMDFDLVIPPMVAPHVWIGRVRKLIEDSRALRRQTEALRVDSMQLREEALHLRKGAEAEREASRVKRERERSAPLKNPAR